MLCYLPFLVENFLLVAVLYVILPNWFFIYVFCIVLLAFLPLNIFKFKFILKFDNHENFKNLSSSTSKINIVNPLLDKLAFSYNLNDFGGGGGGGSLFKKAFFLCCVSVHFSLSIIIFFFCVRTIISLFVRISFVVIDCFLHHWITTS